MTKMGGRYWGWHADAILRRSFTKPPADDCLEPSALWFLDRRRAGRFIRHRISIDLITSGFQISGGNVRLSLPTRLRLPVERSRRRFQLLGHTDLLATTAQTVLINRCASRPARLRRDSCCGGGGSLEVCFVALLVGSRSESGYGLVIFCRDITDPVSSIRHGILGSILAAGAIQHCRWPASMIQECRRSSKDFSVSTSSKRQKSSDLHAHGSSNEQIDSNAVW